MPDISIKNNEWFLKMFSWVTFPADFFFFTLDADIVASSNSALFLLKLTFYHLTQYATKKQAKITLNLFQVMNSSSQFKKFFLFKSP